MCALVEALEAFRGRQALFYQLAQEAFTFILATGTAVPEEPGCVPSLAAGTAGADRTGFLLHASHCKAELATVTVGNGTGLW